LLLPIWEMRRRSASGFSFFNRLGCWKSSGTWAEMWLNSMVMRLLSAWWQAVGAGDAGRVPG
jgi:hypothetical protein